MSQSRPTHTPFEPEIMTSKIDDRRRHVETLAALTPAQCRAARGLLRISQEGLAHAAGLGYSTIRKFEAEIKYPVSRNLAAISETLQHLGVIFIGETEQHGPGVVLKSSDILADPLSLSDGIEPDETVDDQP